MHGPACHYCQLVAGAASTPAARQASDEVFCTATRFIRPVSMVAISEGTHSVHSWAGGECLPAHPKARIGSSCSALSQHATVSAQLAAGLHRMHQHHARLQRRYHHITANGTVVRLQLLTGWCSFESVGLGWCRTSRCMAWCCLRSSDRRVRSPRWCVAKLHLNNWRSCMTSNRRRFRQIACAVPSGAVERFERTKQKGQLPLPCPVPNYKSLRR
jgi:hypothetical protein